MAKCVPPCPGRFPVSRVCSATSQVDFRSSECVPPRPGSISYQQSVFRHVPGQFPVGRVCSATSLVDFRSAECVSPRPVSISGLRFSKVSTLFVCFHKYFINIDNANLPIVPKNLHDPAPYYFRQKSTQIFNRIVQIFWYKWALGKHKNHFNYFKLFSKNRRAQAPCACRSLA